MEQLVFKNYITKDLPKTVAIAHVDWSVVPKEIMENIDNATTVVTQNDEVWILTTTVIYSSVEASGELRSAKINTSQKETVEEMTEEVTKPSWWRRIINWIKSILRIK